MPSREAVVAVDDQGGLQALVLLVAVDVDQLGQRAQLLQHPGRPVRSAPRGLALEGVLVVGAALAARRCAGPAPAAGRLAPGHLGELAAQPGDDLVRRWPCAAPRASGR